MCVFVIRKFHGHSSLKEYYEKESCVHYIHNVRTSEHCIQAALPVCWCVCVCFQQSLLSFVTR